MTDKEVGYSNVFWNTLEPFMNGKSFQGALQYVAIEVLVGQAIRRMAFGLPYNWLAAAETHVYSIPMIGQLNFGDPFKDIPRKKKDKVELTDEAKDGAKAIPGAVIGYCAHKIRAEGVKIPNFANKEVIALCSGK